MKTSVIDKLYTDLANAIDRVGVEKTHLFLATLALSLLSQYEDDETATIFIEQAERLAKN